MHETTYLEGFRSMVRRYPEKVAVVTPTGREVTYRELDRRSDTLAGALDTALDDGRCAVLSENRLAVVESMLAGMKRGRANVQLFSRSAVGELVSMVESAEAQGLIFDGPHAEEATELVDRVGMDTAIGVGEAADRAKGESYEDVLARTDPSEVPTEPATTPPEATVFFTSGTSSTPKAVLADAEQKWFAANQPALEMSLTASDRAIVCTPWFHQVTDHTWIMAHFLVGATIVLQRSFEPEKVLRGIDDHEITGLLAVPTQLVSMLEANEEVDADLDTLSYVRTGGAIVPDELIRDVREQFTEGVFNTYGLTEGIVNLSFAYPEDQLDHPGTIGKSSFLWDLRVVEAAEPPAKPDPENTVAAGETGEIVGKCPGMTDGYLDRPEQEEALFVDGWLRTGDVARVDEDGYLVITDRIDNMIVCGGENIYPNEVQRALEEHPGVQDAAVVGLDDDSWGQVVSAAVVVEDGVSQDDLERHCREHDTLSDYKRPRNYVLLSGEESLPRTATGTLQQEEVMAMFET